MSPRLLLFYTNNFCARAPHHEELHFLHVTTWHQLNRKVQSTVSSRSSKAGHIYSGLYTSLVYIQVWFIYKFGLYTNMYCGFQLSNKINENK